MKLGDQLKNFKDLKNLGNLKQQIKNPLKFFHYLPSDKKRLVSFGIAAFILLTLTYFVYKDRIRQTQTPFTNQPVASEDYKSLFSAKEIHTSYVQQLKQQLEEMQKKMSLLESSLQQEKTEKEQLQEEIKKLLKAGPEQQKQSPVKTEEEVHKPEKEKEKTLPPVVRAYSGEIKKSKKGKARPILIGGIGGGDNEVKKRKKQEHKEKHEKEKECETVYLPPSFVKADLLTGFTAFANMQGKRNPSLLLLRLRDLAVLPNDIKANLKGCFVIAEAYANLADEKAHVRLLRLACLALDGSAVIEEPVQGWVVDENGEIGLKGHVYAEMGKYLSRLFFAGILSSAGDAFKTQSALPIISETVKNVNLMALLKTGLASGTASVASKMADFYLELAKQALPVIEVLPGKRVTVIFSKGVVLHIRKKYLVNVHQKKEGGYRWENVASYLRSEF